MLCFVDEAASSFDGQKMATTDNEYLGAGRGYLRLAGSLHFTAYNNLAIQARPARVLPRDPIFQFDHDRQNV
jgi:hypothetical protein